MLKAKWLENLKWEMYCNDDGFINPYFRCIQTIETGASQILKYWGGYGV